jgi:hypothetical protein
MKYEVVFEPYTDRHFIRSFAKKYQGAWERTLKGLELEFNYADLLFEKQIAETIVDSTNIKICKTEFKIAGTDLSRHSSGNRCIVALHKDTKTIHVLLVYNKTNIGGHNETAEWKRIVKENYAAYASLL